MNPALSAAFKVVLRHDLGVVDLDLCGFELDSSAVSDIEGDGHGAVGSLSGDDIGQVCRYAAEVDVTPDDGRVGLSSRGRP